MVSNTVSTRFRARWSCPVAQIRKYLEAADAALNQAVVDLPKKPETQVWHDLAAERPNILLYIC